MLARRAVQKGDWKIIWLEAPWDENEGWALYNIKDDPAEAQDLSKQHPEVLADLLMDWEAFVAENGVIALDKIKLTYAMRTAISSGCLRRRGRIQMTSLSEKGFNPDAVGSLISAFCSEARSEP